ENKADNPDFADLRFNLYELHFGDPIAVTAIHADGLDELESRMAEDLKKLGFKKRELEKLGDDSLKISFLGRPNVGKSTMINAILGETRLVTSATPGTTRDSTHVPFKYKDEDFTLVDTAGVRRRGSIEKGLEKYSILRTFQAVELSDICVLLLDAEEGITKQDCHVSEFILNEKKGLILVLNKFDQFKGEEKDQREDQLIRELRHKMDYIPWAPVVFTSALKQKNVFHVLDLASEIRKERAKKIPQSELTIWLSQVLRKHPPVGTRGKRRFSVLSVEQSDTNPPQFVFNCNWPEIMHFSYGRYLENELRNAFGFTGTALQLIFRKPHDEGARRPSVTKGRRRASSSDL
ncbi:MAG: ribosome biogenesis GTPase Der, partial [Patescibacteria group bacterium]